MLTLSSQLSPLPSIQDTATHSVERGILLTVTPVQTQDALGASPLAVKNTVSTLAMSLAQVSFDAHFFSPIENEFVSNLILRITQVHLLLDPLRLYVATTEHWRY